MVKENTHLFFADKILNNVSDEEIREIISSNIGYYYLGSIIPDSFFYHNKEKISQISEMLHGKDGNKTNGYIFSILDSARSGKLKKDLAFVFGYLSHCALDIIFHPIIYYYSGNYYDTDKEKRNMAVYLHRSIETFLDRKWNDSFFLDRIINAELLDNLLFPDLLVKDMDVPVQEIFKSLRRQIYYNRLFRYRVPFMICSLLVKLGLFSKTNLGLFYSNLEKDKIFLDEDLTYKDIVSGEPKTSTLGKLFDESVSYGCEMINSAYRYYHGEISEDESRKIISGKSLDTGKLNIGVK